MHYANTSHLASQSSQNSPAVDEGYEVRLATESELHAVFKLRYEVFYNELGADDSVSNVAGLDVDNYDEICDHLIVVHKIRKTDAVTLKSSIEQNIVGTYRMLPLSRLNGTGLNPYSSAEFNLSTILNKYNNNIVELGRSCVHKNYRTGMIPRLMWAGLAQYIFARNIDAVIGCVSVHGLSDVQALRLARAVQDRGQWNDELESEVQEKYKIAEEAKAECLTLAAMLPSDAYEMMPPLMKGYFNLGAKICGGPAWDKPFGVHDYLILLDCQQISPKYYKALVKPFVDKGIARIQ